MRGQEVKVKLSNWRNVNIHKSGNSKALYIPKSIVAAMFAGRRVRALEVRYHRGLLIARVKPVKPARKRAPVEAVADAA